MAPVLTAPLTIRFTRQQGLVCVLACIGFAFDTYELLVLPL